MPRRQCDDLLAGVLQKRISSDCQPTRPQLHQCRKSHVDLSFRAGSQDIDALTDDTRRLFNVGKFEPEIRIVRINQDTNQPGRRNHLSQKPEPLSFRRGIENAYAGGVAAGSVHAGDETLGNRVAPAGENNWDRRGCGLSRQRRCTAALSDQNAHPPVN
jgi:hypothetical protein